VIKKDFSSPLCIVDEIQPPVPVLPEATEVASLETSSLD